MAIGTIDAFVIAVVLAPLVLAFITRLLPRTQKVALASRFKKAESSFFTLLGIARSRTPIPGDYVRPTDS